MNSLKIGATPPFSCLSSIELRSKRKTNTTRRDRTFSTSKLILIRHHVLVNLGYNLLWYMARSSRESLKEGMSDEQIRKISRSYLSALPVYVAAIPAALWHPFVGLALFVLPWTIWARLRYTSKEDRLIL
jgi:hypothetical protein